MNENKIYTLAAVQVVAPGGTGAKTFTLDTNNSYFKVKSIYLDLRIQYPAPGYANVLNLAQQTTQSYGLAIIPMYNVPPRSFASLFTNHSILAAVTNLAGYIGIFKVGQTFFDSFRVQGGLFFSFWCTNNDLLNTYQHGVNIIVEIEHLKDN